MGDDRARIFVKARQYMSHHNNGRYMTARSLQCPSYLLLLLLMLCQQSTAMCPARCRCNDDELHASCADARLQVVPIQLNPEVKHINLSNNKINSIHFTLEIYANLITLDLSNNKILKLGSKNFISQHHLKTLNLSNNQIESLEKDVFKGLRSLKILDLTSNSIERITANVFHDMHSLETLQLANNRIVSFEDDLLKHQTNLRLLVLNNNQLLDIPTANLKFISLLERLEMSSNLVSNISNDSFPNMKSLQYLSLDQNIITEINNKAFHDFQNLQYINLADNNFTNIPTTQLSKLANLSELDLSGNFIRNIQPVAFRGLFKLNRLHLNRLESLNRIDARAFVDNINLENVSLNDNSALSIIPTRIFHGNPRVINISVRNNMLTTLDASHFPLDQLQSLELSGNPFNCNCSLLWLWKLANEQLQKVTSNVTLDSNDLIFDIDGIRCTEPKELSDSLLVDVPESDIQCSLNWIAIVSVCATVTSILISIIAVYIFYGNFKCCRHKKRLERAREPSTSCPNRNSSIYEEPHQANGSKYEINKYMINTPPVHEYQTLPHWEILNKNKNVSMYKQFGYHTNNMPPQKPHIVYV